MDSLPLFVISAILFVVGYDLATSPASGYLRFETLFGLMAAMGLGRIFCAILLRVGADQEGCALASCTATSDCGDSTTLNDSDFDQTCSFSSATRATPTTASQDEAKRRPDRPLPITIHYIQQTNRPRFASPNTSVAMRPYRYVPSCKSRMGPYTRPARRSLNLSLIPPRTVPARHSPLVVHIPLRATTVARVCCVSATQARAPPPPPPPSRPSRPPPVLAPPPPPPVLQALAPHGPKQPHTLLRRPARTLPVIPMEVDPPSPSPLARPPPPPPPPCDSPWPWHARALALLSTVDKPQDYYAALERARAARPVFPWAMLVDSD